MLRPSPKVALLRPALSSLPDFLDQAVGEKLPEVVVNAIGRNPQFTRQLCAGLCPPGQVPQDGESVLMRQAPDLVDIRDGDEVPKRWCGLFFRHWVLPSGGPDIHDLL